jgi:MFS family permease
MSTSKTRGHFLVGRVFLGCIEAGLFPGALYLLTCWYKKAEVGTLDFRDATVRNTLTCLTGKRFAIFYTSGTISPALGGLMAGAIMSSLDGRGGWEGW